jgi:hypothetical protein
MSLPTSYPCNLTPLCVGRLLPVTLQDGAEVRTLLECTRCGERRRPRAAAPPEPANVVQMPGEAMLRNVPAALRELAARIERGEEPTPDLCLVLLTGPEDPGVATFFFGRSPNGFELAGVLAGAQHSVLNGTQRG